MPWYTLQTKPNYEAKVIEQIEQKKQEHNLVQIRDIFSPSEPIVEYKDGKRIEKNKRLFSNYLLVDMDYDDNIWHILKGIKGVVGFLGNKNNPIAVPDREVASIKARMSGEAPKPKIVFALEAKVRITSGSFADFYGVIKEVDYEKNKAKVAINIFNRETKVDIELTALELSKD